MSILALDVATNCGRAVSNHNGRTWNLGSRGKENKDLRLRRLLSKLGFCHRNYGTTEIAFERIDNSNVHMQAIIVQFELQGVMKCWCLMHNVSYHAYFPSSIKKHATGKGNASKALMVQSAESKWPDAYVVDDNHADALHTLNLNCTSTEKSFPSRKEDL